MRSSPSSEPEWPLEMGRTARQPRGKSGRTVRRHTGDLATTYQCRPGRGARWRSPARSVGCALGRGRVGVAGWASTRCWSGRSCSSPIRRTAGLARRQPLRRQLLGRQRPGEGHADLGPRLQLSLGAHVLGVQMDPSRPHGPPICQDRRGGGRGRADLAGSTRMSAPPCPLAATAMLPPDQAREPAERPLLGQ
jgi:hypothetical protein